MSGASLTTSHFGVDTEVSRRFERTTVLVALAYERWSDYPGPLGSTLECPDDVPTCGTSAPPPPNASDVFVPRLAGSHEFSIARMSSVVRAGYAFVPAALPEQRGAANAFDSARHGLSLGYSLGLPPRRRAAPSGRGVPARSPGSPHPRKVGWLGDSNERPRPDVRLRREGRSMTAPRRLPGSRFAPAALAALVGFSSLSAGASPGARAGFGSRSQALAGAEVADARSGAAVFENPAALVQTPDTELSLGTSYTTYDFAIDGRDAGLASVPTLRLCRRDSGVGPHDSRRFRPRAVAARRSLLEASQRRADDSPTYPLDDSGPRLLDLGMALALRPMAWLALGGGVGFLAAAQGGFRVTGTAVAADGSGSEYASELRHSVDADLISVRYPIFGATLTPSKQLVLGLLISAARRPSSSASPASSWARPCSGRPRFPCATASRRARASRSCRPCSRSAATARPHPDWRVSAQLDWEGWSSYPSPYARPKTDARGRSATRRRHPAGRAAAAAGSGRAPRSLRSARRSGATFRGRSTARARRARGLRVPGRGRPRPPRANAARRFRPPRRRPRSRRRCSGVRLRRSRRSASTSTPRSCRASRAA